MAAGSCPVARTCSTPWSWMASCGTDAQIIIAAVDGSDRRVLIAGGSDAVRPRPGTSSTGARDLCGPSRSISRPGCLTGSAAVVLADVMLGEANGQAHYSVSANGTLVYLSGRDTQQERSLMLRGPRRNGEAVDQPIAVRSKRPRCRRTAVALRRRSPRRTTASGRSRSAGRR